MECTENNHSSPGIMELAVALSPAQEHKPVARCTDAEGDSEISMNESSLPCPMHESLKRKADIENEEDDCSSPKEPKLSVVDIIPKLKGPRNALSTLHELYRGIDFKITDQEGPINSPVFTASVEINGFVFEGKGKNKKLAKHSAAEAALKSLVQLKNPGLEAAILYKNQGKDFSDDALYKDVSDYDIERGDRGSKIRIQNDENEENSNNTDKDEPVACKIINKVNANGVKYSDKNPVMLLNELHPYARYELVSENKDQAYKYTMAVIVNGQRFEGQGSSKKLGKAAAARNALSLFYNVIVPDTPSVSEECFTPSDSTSLPQKFVDQVASLVRDKFEHLIPQYSVHHRKKVLAGFVLSRKYELASCKVLTISTGTKCINGERMSVNGSVLYDSHAEIISRRCLCAYFYRELEKLADEKEAENSIFTFKSDGGCKLKDDYKFHLFINTAPCGDSRIFSPFDGNLADKHPNRKARGQLRTKIECGEGTIPVKSAVGMQTWDGVLLGERLLTMSCSDKIAKWNIVGLQGALLSNFLEPIYLDSIILGSLYHPHHLYRAVYGRIEKSVSGLTPPYLLNKPRLAGTVNTDKRQVGKAPVYSINWTIGDDSIEAINTIIGKTDQNRISRISKCKLFYRFLNLLEKIPTSTGLKKAEGPMLYSFCKESAREFQQAKSILFKALSRHGLGEWMKKPLEVDQFEWDIDSLERFFHLDDIENPSAVSNENTADTNTENEPRTSPEPKVG